MNIEVYIVGQYMDKGSMLFMIDPKTNEIKRYIRCSKEDNSYSDEDVLGMTNFVKTILNMED